MRLDEVDNALREELTDMELVTDAILYSRVSIATSGAGTSKKFFAKAATDAMTDSNMERDYQLAEGEVFVFDRIRVALPPDATLPDAKLLLKEAILEFKPSPKAPSRRWPLEVLGAGGGLVASIEELASAADISCVSNGVPAQNAVYRLAKPEKIVGGVQFTVKIHWATEPTPAAATKITVMLDGVAATGASKVLA